MRELEISKLMDEYTDNEFFPQGGATVDPRAVKERVLAGLPAKKRRRVPVKTVLLAAAVMALLAGAGLPYLRRQLAAGEVIFDGTVTGLVHYDDFVELDEGRLYFTPPGGTRTDITELTGEDTPYIYDASGLDGGMTYYIILGGTPESYGWFEWIVVPESPDGEADSGPRSMYDGEFIFHPGQEDERSSVIGELYAPGAVAQEDVAGCPWLESALETLGIPIVEGLFPNRVAEE